MDADVSFRQRASVSPLGGTVNDTLTSFYGSTTNLHPSRSATTGHAPDILSASTYPNLVVERRQSKRKPKRKDSQQLYGGFVLHENEITSSNISRDQRVDDNPSPKKRSKRSSRSDEDDIKKQRGRPRLDTQDETAADRRRTQIRLAQRAYRHRKETTISALKKRVTELECTIEQMNKSFLEFHDNAIDSGALLSRPTLARQLKATTEDFVHLAKIGSFDSDHEEEAANIAELEYSNEAESSAPVDRQNASQQQGFSNDQVSLGYEMSFEVNDHSDGDIEELPQFMATDGSSSGTLVSQNDSSLKEWSFLNSYQQLNAEVYNTSFDFADLLPPIERPLKADVPYTYSFQETTFARRLHRLCLERAFRVLTNPNVDPEYIKRAFRFTFSFSNKRRMLGRFQELLKRKAGESLENWNVPFFRIGGAGTHFPRLDEKGMPVYPPNVLSPARAFGPLSIPSPEVPRDEATVEELLESIGFGGTWFDAHDVESYLRTKGIYLDGSSSLIDVDPRMIERAPPLLLSSSSTGSSHSGASPSTAPATPIADTTMPFMDGTFLYQELPDPYSTDMADVYADKGMDVTMGAAMDVNFMNPTAQSGTPTIESVLARRDQPMTLDVSKMLERMVNGSACLGRAPGFRRKDIDNALLLALQEAF